LRSAESYVPADGTCAAIHSYGDFGSPRNRQLGTMLQECGAY
jgi:hypothetical protein